MLFNFVTYCIVGWFCLCCPCDKKKVKKLRQDILFKDQVTKTDGNSRQSMKEALTLYSVHQKFQQATQERLPVKNLYSAINLLDSDSDPQELDDELLPKTELGNHPEEQIVYCKRGHLAYNRKTLAREIDSSQGGVLNCLNELGDPNSREGKKNPIRVKGVVCSRC